MVDKQEGRKLVDLIYMKQGESSQKVRRPYLLLSTFVLSRFPPPQLHTGSSYISIILLLLRTRTGGPVFQSTESVGLQNCALPLLCEFLLEKYSFPIC